MKDEPLVCWAHNTITSGDGTVPVIMHASHDQLSILGENVKDWHQASPDEYLRYEWYWAKEFPHMDLYVIEETP